MTAAPAAPATGPRRVQRVAEQWPVVHLEVDEPEWSGLTVDGLVRHARALSLRDLAVLGEREETVPLHCVWGWSKPEVVWTGVRLGAVLDLAGVDCGDDAYVVVSSASDTYASCLPLEDAARGILAWARDGAPLSPVAGGPLRYVGPDDYWAYKGVKWAARVSVVDRFRPGFWEAKLADPLGRIPDEVELP